MSSATLENEVVLDELLYQSVVDEEFRALLLSDPAAFGLAELSVALPSAIEPQDRSLLDLASGANYIVMCRSTCSSGPFTIVCDGTTK